MGALVGLKRPSVASARDAPDDLAELVATVVRQVLAEDLEVLVQRAVDARLSAAMSERTGPSAGPAIGRGTLEAATRGVLAAIGPGAAGGGELHALMRRDGDCWSMRYSADAFFVRDTKGMRYLAALLAQPHREVAALALAADIDGVTACAVMPAIVADDHLTISGGGSAGQVLDWQARESYRRRLAELEAAVEEGERFNDPERCFHARAETEALTRELSAALGLGGRARRVPGQAERARQRVTKAIRGAIARLADHDVALAEHLTRTIRTGAICIYDPDPRAVVTWNDR